MKNALSLFVSGALGMLHGASFAANHSFICNFVAWFCLSLLLAQRRRAIFPVIFSFFFGSFSFGLWWMALSLVQVTSLGPALGSISFVVCCSLLAAIPAVAICSVNALTGERHWTIRALTLAAAVSLAEFLRVRVLTGFPWLQIGHAYIDTPFAPLLPWIGSHAVGLLAVGAAMLAGMTIVRAPRRRGSLALVVTVTGVVTTALFAENKYVSASRDAVRTESPTRESLQVTLLQPALDTSHKFDRARLREHLQQLISLGAHAGNGAVVIAPETAIPTTWNALPARDRTSFENLIREHGQRWRVGAFAASQSRHPSNVVITLDDTGVTTRYHKQHLVYLLPSTRRRALLGSLS